MADLLNVGTRALNAFQTAISTTGNNIVNANTEGYSRQRVNFATETSQFNGGYYVGNGVGIESVQRIYDEVLRTELLTRSSSQASMDALYGLSSQLERLFSEPEFGVQGSLDSYQAAISGVANNPGSLPERQVLIAEAQNLVHRIGAVGESLESIDNTVRLRIESDLESINDLSARITDINLIIDSNRSASVEPNELLDQRELLLRDLAEKVDIHTITQDSGVVAVYMSNGTALVNGAQSIQLSAQIDEFGTGIEINQQGVSGGISMAALSSGGSLGGILQFQNDVLKPTIEEFGLMSLTLTKATNRQQGLGLDLNGNPGADLFQVPTIGAVQSQHNRGAADVSVSLIDFSQMDSSEYELEFDGVLWTLSNLNSGASSTGVAPISLEGIELSVTGTANAGDRFLIQPSVNSLGEITLALNDPNGIAAAASLRTSSSLSNAGNSSVAEIQITDVAMLPLAADVQLTFDLDALGVGIPGFTVTGITGGPLSFDPSTDSGGVNYSLAGFDFQVSGAPNAGDTHSIINNFGSSGLGATGDNTNAQTLADLLDSKLLTSGNRSLSDINASLLGFLGSKTAGAESSLSIENTLLSSAEQSLISVSGVNLDEEAADLLRFQQAYQASAQIISVAEELFDALLNATR